MSLPLCGVRVLGEIYRPGQEDVAVDRLADMLTAAMVQRLAGSRVFARGVAYCNDDRVEPGEFRDGRYCTTVVGTMPYKVELWCDDGKPGWCCTCPAAEDGSFCKHCTAAALALTAGSSPSRMLGPVDGDAEAAADWNEIVDFVEGLSQRQLAELVLDAVRSSRRFRDRISAKARTARGDGPNIAAWHKRVDKAFDSYGRYVDYREVDGWAEGVLEMINDLEAFCNDGHPDMAIEIAEYALVQTDRAVDYVDDSESGCVMEIFERLSDLHLLACEQGHPDPVDLAARLLKLELTSELGFHHSADIYAEILGKDGLAAFHTELKPLWDHVTHDADGKKYGTRISTGAFLTTGAFSTTSAFSVTSAMEGWAMGTDDPDIIINVYSHNPLTPGRLGSNDALIIARTLIQADREDEAIAWAQRGLEENSSYEITSNLRDCLADVFRRRNDDRAAENLYWKAFYTDPSVRSYRGLLKEAAANEDIPQRCVDTLRSRLTAHASNAAPPNAATASFHIGKQSHAGSRACLRFVVVVWVGMVGV